jgi:hypothetical protein
VALLIEKAADLPNKNYQGNNTADNPLSKWHFLLKKQQICPTRTTEGMT